MRPAACHAGHASVLPPCLQPGTAQRAISVLIFLLCSMGDEQGLVGSSEYGSALNREALWERGYDVG